MPTPATEIVAEPDAPRGVRLWLGVVAAMVVAIILVGGATRLTESGLSIVEWKLVTGVLPPLTAEAWNEAFAAYKQIPQYVQINRGMSLDEFKVIFWWEWSHRLIGRMIGIVFLLPFLYFLWRGGLSKGLKIRLWILFALGGLQGAIGWWMVASGLSGRTEVSQYRLAVHLMLAIVIFSVIVRTIIRMTPRAPLPEAPPRLTIASHAILGLIYLQIYFGALVAGLRAGKAYNTWPLIDGAIIPSADRLFFESPWWRNFFDNVLTVQFSHRMIAYTLMAAVLWHAIDVLRSGADNRVVRGALWLVAATFAQAVIGIMTLLYNVPIDIALAHQGGAVVVLTLALLQSERLSSARAPQAVPAQALSA